MVYGSIRTPSWDGVSTPTPFQVAASWFAYSMPMLAAVTVNARPVQRGILIREALMCEKTYEPLDAGLVVEPQLDHTMNTRQVIENLTEDPNSQCYGCHYNYFNGLGFATGHFNALGKYQESEPMFTENCLGISDTPSLIESSGVTMSGNQLVSFSGGEELSGLLLDSGKLEECFARQFFRYSFRRTETEDEEEFIVDLGQQLYTGIPMDEVLSRWCIQNL